MHTLTLIRTPWLTLLLAWPRRARPAQSRKPPKPMVRIAGLR